MKKVVRLTESDLVRLVKRVIYEQPILRPGMKQFEAEAYTEDDAITPYYVSKFVTSGSNVKMYLENNTLYSINFHGPLYDARTNKIVEPRAGFINVDEKNYKQIAKQYNIPLQ